MNTATIITISMIVGLLVLAITYMMKAKKKKKVFVQETVPAA